MNKIIVVSLWLFILCGSVFSQKANEYFEQANVLFEKGDYANAYYNLAIALRDKGDQEPYQ